MRGGDLSAGVIDMAQVTGIVARNRCKAVQWDAGAAEKLSFSIITKKRTYYVRNDSGDICVPKMPGFCHDKADKAGGEVKVTYQTTSGMAPAVTQVANFNQTVFVEEKINL